MTTNTLSNKQLTAITANAITVKMLITYPRALFALSGSAAWINVVYCTLLCALIFFAAVSVYGTGGSVIELSHKLGGKAAGALTSVFVFMVMGAGLVSLIRIYPEMIKLSLLQNTYTEIIILAFAAALVLGARFGIEAAARAHAVFIPLAAAAFVIFILLLIPSFDINNIFPILGKGAHGLFIKGIPTLSVFSDLLMLNILIPYMKNGNAYKTAGTRAIWIGGLCAFLITAAYGLCYVFPVSEEFLAPIYQLERLIHLSDFFSRFEAVFQFIWSVSVLLYGSIYLAVMAEVWREGFGLRHSKPLVLPTAAILTLAALIPNSLNDMTVWEYKINRWLYIPALGIPILAGIINKIINVSRETSGRREQ